MAGDSFLPPVIAVLAADITAYTAGLTEAEARMTAFVESQTAALAELDARMASMGAGMGAEAGAGAAAGVDTEAAAASVAAVQADNEALLASFEQVGAASTQMAAEVESSYGAMAARTAELSQGMVAAEREAVAANATVGESMAGAGVAVEAGAAKAATGADGMAKAGGLMSQAMFGAKLGLAAAAVESVKMAGDFQSATERLALSAGEDQRNVDMVRQGMLTMAGQVGYSADQLAAAMYKVESGGQHGADGLKVLQAAAEGAKTENADLTTVADALTSAMTDYHLPADQAATVTSKLVAATSQGKMTFQELAGSLAAVLPVASANHVALNDILGDEASMTMHGMSAEQATQNLADAIRHMAAPTQAQSKELAALGLNATEVSKSLGEQGLSGTINTISDRIRSQMGPDGMVVLDLTNALKGMAPAVQQLGAKVLDGSMSMKDFTASAKAMGVINDKNVTSFATLAGSMHGIGTEAKSGAEVYQTYSGALKQAMGDATGMNVALMIGGENAGNTAKAISAVSAATAEAGNHVEGWAQLQQTFNQKWAEFKDGLGAAAIQIGTALLPVLGALLGVLGSVFKILADHPVLLVGLAAVIGTALAPAIWAAVVATAAWTVALLANPLTWIALLVAGLAMAAYELIEHWRGVAGFFEGLWGDIKTIFHDAVGAVMEPIHAIETAWNSFWGGFANPEATLADTVHGIDRIFLEIGEGERRFLDDIGSALDTVWTIITTPFRLAWDAVKFLFTHSPDEIAQAIGYGLGRLTRITYDFGLKVVHGIEDGAKAAWRDVVTFFTQTLPNFFTQTIPQFATRVGNDLLNAGKTLIHDLYNGLVAEKNDIVTFFTVTLPQFFTQTIPQFATRVGHDLMQAGTDILRSLERGAETGYHAVADFFTALPGRVLQFFENAPKWLYDTGRDILTGLWNGITSFFGNIFSGIDDFIHNMISGFMRGFGVASPSTIFHNIGGDVIQGLWNGVVDRWNAFWGWASQLPGWLVNNLIPNAAGLLVNVGYNIVVGIWNGIASGWGWLTGKVSSLASSLLSTAKSALGISSPSQLFADEVGAWIGPGIAQGLDANAQHAVTAAEQMVRQVAGTLGLLNTPGAPLSAAGAAGGPSLALTGSGAGAGGGVTVQVTVQGNVWTTQELVRELQTELLKYGIRNTSSGTNYAFA